MPGKVSVVIPVYQVEKYLHRCVESVINQSYQDLEIILVNDGSPDNCGAIADNYARQDKRIRACHKQNGGLSDARNYGMKFAGGEYLLFVDSDDWLKENMIAECVAAMEKYQADVVQSAFYYAYDNCLLLDNRYNTAAEPPVLLDNRTLMKELLFGEKVKNFAWGKLYRRTLIQDIPFEKGVLFEDIFWTYQIFHRVSRYVILHQPLCFYYQREGSIVSSYSEKNLDMLRGLKERHHFIEKNYVNLLDSSYKLILKESLHHYNLLWLNKKIDREGICRERIRTYIKANRSSLLRAANTDVSLKVQLYLFLFHPAATICYLAVRKILRKLKLIPQPAGLKEIPISSKPS